MIYISINMGRFLVPHWQQSVLLQLHRVRRCWRQSVCVGLENNQTLQQVACSRQCMHCSSVASTWAEQGGHCRLGWPHQILGLISSTILLYLIVNIYIFLFCLYMIWTCYLLLYLKCKVIIGLECIFLNRNRTTIF